MNDQKAHWDKNFEEGIIRHHTPPSDFSKEVLNKLKKNSYILELGCGAGNDSVAFAAAEHKILATDFSEVAINKCKERFENQSKLEFDVLDIRQPLPSENETFDAVYARLSLHYFTENETRKIFLEINRVLKPSGQLFFLCKSTDDPLYGKGEKIEEDMFEYKGHIRHFFNEEFTRSCLDGLFEIIKLEKGEDTFYNSESAYIKVFAEKSHQNI